MPSVIKADRGVGALLCSLRHMGRGTWWVRVDDDLLTDYRLRCMSGHRAPFMCDLFRVIETACASGHVISSGHVIKVTASGLESIATLPDGPALPVALPRQRTPDFSPPARLPTVGSVYIRPDGLQHTQALSRRSNELTPYQPGYVR